ncbi:MAG TPA: LysR family transcriptional regulator [Candidatus Acidoferrum sp.]|nr:LysR family transcriptional regulator [Candidatus Acidoferrum sp.]
MRVIREDGGRMNLEIRHLKLVAAIAETGSVTRAGNRLHLTQSALSHQLRDAEEQLGTALFERKRGKMILTTAGERLLETARTVLCELERAETEIQQNGTVAKGRIRISTQCHTVYHWLPPRLSFFQRQFPDVEVQLVIEATNNPFEALLEGKLDLAIVNEPIRNRKIRYLPLFEDETLIAVPPEHPLARKSCAAPQDFATETILLYPPKEDSTLLMKILEPAGIRPRKVLEVTLTEAIIEMVIGGLGIAALPKWTVAPQLASGALIGVPLKPPGCRWTWSIAQLRENRAPAYVQEFISILAKRPLYAEFSPRMRGKKNRSARRAEAAA